MAISKCFGFAREFLIAFHFGTQEHVSLFFLALTYSGFITSFVIQLNTSIIPLIASSQHQISLSIWMFFNFIITIFLLIILLSINKIFAYCHQQHLYAYLRMLMPYMLLCNLQNTICTFYKSYRHFLKPSIIEIILNGAVPDH